jgi:hypothetical protein
MGYADTLARGVEQGTVTPETVLDRLVRIKSAAEQIGALLNDLESLVEDAEDEVDMRSRGLR